MIDKKFLKELKFHLQIKRNTQNIMKFFVEEDIQIRDSNNICRMIEKFYALKSCGKITL